MYSVQLIVAIPWAGPPSLIEFHSMDSAFCVTVLVDPGAKSAMTRPFALVKDYPFRWFQFILEPPYSMVHGKFSLDSLYNFCHICTFGTVNISLELFQSFLKYVTLWWFQGYLSTSGKKNTKKIKFFSLRQWHLLPPPFDIILAGQVYRPHHEPSYLYLQCT